MVQEVSRLRTPSCLCVTNPPCSVSSRSAVSFILGAHCTPRGGPLLPFDGVVASRIDFVGVPGYWLPSVRSFEIVP